MSAMGKLVALICSICLVAFLLANILSSGPASKAELSADSHTDKAVKNFFAYRGTDAKAQNVKHQHDDPDCKPCAAKAAAMRAGGVPSQPLRAKTDPPFQRITGRASDYVPPIVPGTAMVRIPEQVDAWVSIAHGLPFGQLRCHIILSATGITISSISGITTSDKIITVGWQAEAPAQLGLWGPLITMGAQDIWHTMQALPETVTYRQAYGRYQAHAVSLERIFLVASAPAKLFCDDVEIQLTKEGLPTRITHVQATDTSDNGDSGDSVIATRQIWLINNP